METARGRAFLQEHARRSRAADTTTLLAAIGRIESLLASRELEPAEPARAQDVPHPESAEASEAVDESVAAAAPHAAREMMDAVSLPADIFELGPVQPAAPAFHVAIEFLGPDVSQAEPPAAISAPPPVRPQRRSRDPFADIRALSEQEKIALFT